VSSHEDYWKKQAEHSWVKTEIVVKYFRSWASIMKTRCKQLTYLDLFSGRGAFEDGTLSTPLLILNEVVGDTTLQRCLRVLFYEGNDKNFRELKSSVENHSAFHMMSIKPDLNRTIIKRDIIRQLPIDDCTFCFIDPFGYRGVSLELLWLVTKNWGCDCLFYLSTNGILRNVQDPTKTAQMQELFGNSGFEAIKKELTKPLRRSSFEVVIHRELEKTLRGLGIQFYRSFCVEFDKRRGTSHHLVFITKHWLGFKIMKDIMADYSIKDTDNIPQYRYSKIDEQQLPLPFSYAIDQLKEKLCEDFAGKSLQVEHIIVTCHQRGYAFLDKNIKDALLLLENEGNVAVDKPANQRPKTRGHISLGDKRIVTFMSISRHVN